MAALNTNWVYDKNAVTEKDRNALAKAKKIEERDIRKGYRWYAIDNRTKILIECDKHGNPTKRGLEKIERYKHL